MLLNLKMVKPNDDVYLDDIAFCVSLKNIAKTVSKFKDVSDCSIVVQMYDYIYLFYFCSITPTFQDGQG